MQVLFNVLMGLRRSEINGLKYSDIDYINRTLRVERQLGLPDPEQERLFQQELLEIVVDVSEYISKMT